MVPTAPREWRQAQVAYHVSRRSFLAGEAGPWVEQQRERLQTIFARAGECLAETYIWNGEPTVAIDVAEEVLAAQAFRESAYRLLMRAHVAAGNRADALWVYERCKKLISNELGLRLRLRLLLFILMCFGLGERGVGTQ